MKLTKISVISLALILSSGAAFANVVQVKCDKFIVAIADDMAKAAEERASSVTEAQENVCKAAEQISVSGDEPEVHNIVILPYNIETTVVMIPQKD